MKEQTKNKKMETKKAVVGTENLECKDPKCNIHGNLKTHGRVFEGVVMRKLPTRIAIEFERMSYVKKYERYSKSKTRIHARLPLCMENEINVGDLIQVQECRPLSKIIHFVVIKKIKDISELKK
jgi:small subunit ribosomal protein S17